MWGIRRKCNPIGDFKKYTSNKKMLSSDVTLPKVAPNVIWTQPI